MYFKKVIVLILMVVLQLSCSGSKRVQYKDTEYLEIPPKMKIAEKPKILIEKDEKIGKGLGKSVSLVGTEKKTIIKIKKTFERSWEVVEQALKLNKTEITDKDRDLGVFYVTYDPDDQNSDDSTLFDTMTFSLFKDEYNEAYYKLTVVWRESDTELTASLVDSENNDLLNDTEEVGEDSSDTGSILLKALYKTIRDDLPVN